MALAATMAVAIGGCSKKSSPTQPATHAVTGNVTITGVLRDVTGTTTGTRVVTDAGGIRVYLVSPGAIVDSALTVGGNYRLVGQEGSGYQVRARTGPTLSVSSAPITIGQADVAVAQPLQLTSTGSLATWPNPFTTSLVTGFTVASAGTVGLSVFSLANLRVRALSASSFVAGVHVVIWDGKDDASQAVADGAYWIAFSGDGHEWAELVFKGP